MYLTTGRDTCKKRYTVDTDEASSLMTDDDWILCPRASMCNFHEFGVTICDLELRERLNKKKVVCLMYYFLFQVSNVLRNSSARFEI